VAEQGEEQFFDGVVMQGTARFGTARELKRRNGGMDTMKLSEIKIDTAIMPRTGINWAHVSDLKNAALSGAALPPLVVDRKSHRLVDGLHRWNMLTQLHGADYVADVELRDYANDDELFLAAVEANAAHGLSYSVYDRRRILVEAEKRGIKRELVSSVLKMPVEKAERKLTSGSAFVKTPAGKERVALRTSMKCLAGSTLTKKQEEANKRTGLQVQYHTQAIITLIDAGVMRWGSKAMQDSITDLYARMAKAL
jgi:hypothetical protein